jgi:hypothetical protein
MKSPFKCLCALLVSVLAAYSAVVWQPSETSLGFRLSVYGTEGYLQDQLVARAWTTNHFFSMDELMLGVKQGTYVLHIQSFTNSLGTIYTRDTNNVYDGRVNLTNVFDWPFLFEVGTVKGVSIKP